MTTMVRERLALNDAVYNLIKHISVVGKRSDYTEESLVALVEKIALEQQSLDQPPKVEPKIVFTSGPTHKMTSKSSSQARPQATDKSTASSHTTSHLG